MTFLDFMSKECIMTQTSSNIRTVCWSYNLIYRLPWAMAARLEALSRKWGQWAICSSIGLLPHKSWWKLSEKHLHDLLLEGQGNAKKNQSIRENNLNKCSDMLLLEIWKKHAMASNNLSSTGLVGQWISQKNFSFLRLSGNCLWRVATLDRNDPCRAQCSLVNMVHQNIRLRTFECEFTEILHNGNFPMVRAILGIHVVRYQGGDYIAQGLALRDGGFHCFRSAS